MDMRGPSASSEKTLAERLCECVQELERKRILTVPRDRGAAVPTEPARTFPPFEYPNRGNEACLSSLSISNLHHERDVKCHSPRVTKEKIGPRQGAVGKHRQQRQTLKGTIEVYPADLSNFTAVVFQHTSQCTPSPSRPDVAALPSSPLTPQSVTSTPSARGFMSHPSSPTTPHSIQSRSSSPLPSPQRGYPNGGLYLDPSHHPFAAHTEQSPHLNTHLNVSYPHPLLCAESQNLIPNYNTNLHQSTDVPQRLSASSFGISSEAENVPSNDSQPQGLSPAQYVRALSLERFLLAENAPSNDGQPLGMTAAQYARALSLERILLAGNVPSDDGWSQRTSPAQYARALSLEKILLAEKVPSNDGWPQVVSPAQYARALSIELNDDDTVYNANCMQGGLG